MDDNLFINWQVKERDRNGKMSLCFSPVCSSIHPYFGVEAQAGKGKGRR